MSFKNTLSILLCLIAFLTTITAQELSIEDVKGLQTSHQINHIHKLAMHNDDGLLLADTKFDNGDLDGLLVHFNLKGRVLKEIRVGLIDSYERIVGLNAYENGYYLLLNSVNKQNVTSLLLYKLDKNLSIVSSEKIVVPNIDAANAMVFNPKTNKLEIVVSITDEKGNMFPRLVSYDIVNETQSFLDFSQRNRPEKIENRILNVTVKDKDGNKVNKQMTAPSFVAQVKKECFSIQFSDNNYDELILTGWENSLTITDFWVAKVVDHKIVWQDRFPTKVGGDEGKFTFKTADGYIVFGHEYTKTKTDYYGYRTLTLNKNGKETNAKRFDKDQKDWFKDALKLSDNYFLMFGQTQTIAFPKLRSEEEKEKTSNLWAIIVNDKGEMVTDYVHETENIDEAFVFAKIDNSASLVVFNRDGKLKIAQLIIHYP